MASCSFTSYGRNFTLTVTETSYSIPNNTSNVNWTLSISGGGTTWYDSYAKVIVNGQEVYNETRGWGSGTFPAKDGSVSGTIEGIAHDNLGKKTISFYVEGYSYVYSVSSASGSLPLTEIPRYFTKTPTITLISRTERSATFNWTTSENADRIQYRVNSNGTWVVVAGSGTSGSFTVPGLTPGTTYNIYLDARKADSQLWAQTKPYVNLTTYRTPYITTAPDFNDEDNPKVNYSNPMGNSVSSLQICIASADGQTIYAPYRNISKTGTLYTFNLTNEERTMLRQASVENSMQIEFALKSVISGTTYYSVSYKTLSIINAKPVFNDFEWEEIATQNLTNDHHKVIKGYSKIRTTVSANNKATALKEATITTYQTNVGTKSNTNSNINYPVNVDVSNVDGASITMYAIDSRNNSSEPHQKPIVNYIDYNELTKTENLSTNRTNNIEDETILRIRGTIDLVDFGNVTNAFTQLKYEYKETSSSEWITGTTILTPTLTQKSGTIYNYSIEQAIRGDLGVNGFNVNKSFNIRIVFRDELSEITDSTILASGSPAMAIYKNCIALGGSYNQSVGGRVQMEGKNLQDYFTYSENEVVIGNWIDGKPLYRKVFNTNEQIGNSLTIYHYINNIDKHWIDCSASFMVANNDIETTYPIGNCIYEGLQNGSRTTAKIDDTKITIYSDATFGTNWNKFITIMYTKTTD